MNRKIFNPSGYSVMGFCRNKPLRKILATWCAFATLATTSAPAFAALGFSGDVLSNGGLGGATITESSSGVAVDTNLKNATLSGIGSGVGVVKWSALNVETDQRLTFDGGTWYNVVNSGTMATTINGTIDDATSANVWIFNPAGIAINNGATIELGGIFGAIAAGASYTLDGDDNFASLTVGNAEGPVTIDAGATVTAVQNILAGTTVAVDNPAKLAVADFGKVDGATTMIATDGAVIDSVAGGTVSLKTEFSGSAANTVDLMGNFAKNLIVKTGGGAVTVKDEMTVGTSESPANLSVFGSDLAVTKAVADSTVNLTVNGDLEVKSADGTALRKLTQKTEDSSIASAITVTGDNGINAKVEQLGAKDNVTLTAKKIAGSVTQKDGNKGKITTGEIGGDLDQDGGTVVAQGDTLVVKGKVTQQGTDKSVIGDSSASTVTIDLRGGLNQKSGKIFANTLKIGGDATQQDEDAKITASTVTLDDGLGGAAGDVNLTSTANAIDKVGGKADSVNLVTTKELAVESLDTQSGKSGDGGDITLDAGENAITFTGVNTAKGGTITLNSAATLVKGTGESDSITAGKIANAALLTQKVGTITTPSITGAFTQDGGALKSAADPTTADLGSGGALTQNGGTIVVTNGTLAVAAADAVNGFAVHLAPDTALSLKVNLADEELTRYGIRNVGLAEPFVLGAGMTALPLSVDVSDGGNLPKKGGTVGVLTVSDSATNALESAFSVSKFYRGFKFSSVKIHDDDNGWTTYAARYEPTGCIISFK